MPFTGNKLSVTPNSIATFVNDTQVMTTTASGVSLKQSGPLSSTGTAVTNAMSPYTVLSTDTVLLCATSGGAISIVLPAAAAVSGRIVQVIDASGSANTNNITVTVSGGGTINGAASSVLNTAYASATYVSTGAAWIATATASSGGGGGYPAGVRQVAYASLNTVFSTATNIPLDNTIPQSNEGAEFLTCSITPQSSTSNLYVVAVVSFSNTFSNVSTIGLALFRDAGVNAIGAISIACYQGNTMICAPLNVKTPSSSTAATTFRLRAGGNGNGGTTYVNGNSVTGQLYGGVSTTSLMIMEVGA